MKDNTLIYVGLGLAAVYILSKRTTTVPVSTYPLGTGVIPAGSVQPSQSILTNIFSGIASIVPKIVQSNTASNNVSNGYNADGTINLPNESQQDVNTLLPSQPWNSGPGSVAVNPVNLQLPSIDTGSSSPTGQDIADNDDEFDFSNLYG